jgi:hypothetical protein
MEQGRNAEGWRAAEISFHFVHIESVCLWKAQWPGPPCYESELGGILHLLGLGGGGGFEFRNFETGFVKIQNLLFLLLQFSTAHAHQLKNCSACSCNQIVFQ